MKTEIGNNIANDAIYHLKHFKNLYLAHKKINKILLIYFSTLVISLIAFHVYKYLES